MSKNEKLFLKNVILASGIAGIGTMLILCGYICFNIHFLQIPVQSIISIDDEEWFFSIREQVKTGRNYTILHAYGDIPSFRYPFHNAIGGSGERVYKKYSIGILSGDKVRIFKTYPSTSYNSYFNSEEMKQNGLVVYIRTKDLSNNDEFVLVAEDLQGNRYLIHEQE